MFDDLRLIIKRESKLLICMVAIVLICFALNAVNSLVFKEAKAFLPTMLFAPMCLFSSPIEIFFVGYAVSAAADCLVYITFLLLYRKKKYNYWRKK